MIQIDTEDDYDELRDENDITSEDFEEGYDTFMNGIHELEVQQYGEALPKGGSPVHEPPSIGPRAIAESAPTDSPHNPGH